MQTHRGQVVVHQSAKHSLVRLRRGHALREVPRDDLGHERDETPKRILLVQPGENQKRGLEVHALHVARLGVVRGVRGEDVPERPPSGLTRPELEALLGERRAPCGAGPSRSAPLSRESRPPAPAARGSGSERGCHARFPTHACLREPPSGCRCHAPEDAASSPGTLEPPISPGGARSIVRPDAGAAPASRAPSVWRGEGKRRRCSLEASGSEARFDRLPFGRFSSAQSRFYVQGSGDSRAARARRIDAYRGGRRFRRVTPRRSSAHAATWFSAEAGSSAAFLFLITAASGSTFSASSRRGLRGFPGRLNLLVGSLLPDDRKGLLHAGGLVALDLVHAAGVLDVLEDLGREAAEVLRARRGVRGQRGKTNAFSNRVERRVFPRDARERTRARAYRGEIGDRERTRHIVALVLSETPKFVTPKRMSPAGRRVEVSGRLCLEGSRRFEKVRSRAYLSRSACRRWGTWTSSRPCRRTCGRWS